MALPITTYTDYQSGVYKLPISSLTVSELTEYIDQYEILYLEDLLGCDLAELFIADLDSDGVPQTDRFTNIYDSFCNDNVCTYRRSLGIKIMIKGFIFFEYGRILTTELTMEGVQSSSSENMILAKQSGTKLIPLYNKSIKTYKAIQQYIYDNSSDYPEFEGVNKDLTSYI